MNKFRLITVLALILSAGLVGCDSRWVNNATEMEEDLAKCKEKFKQDCVYAVIPNDKKEDLLQLYKEWEAK